MDVLQQQPDKGQPELMDWYYARGDVRFGPFGDQAIREMAASGELLPGDLVWHTGIGEWKTAATVSGLFVPPRIPSIAPPITAGRSIDP